MIKNKQRFLQIIENDCKLAYQYYEPETGETCAFGALAQALGFDMDRFKNYHLGNLSIVADKLHVTISYSDESRERDEAYVLLAELREAVEAEFGLTPDEQTSIQRANDSFSFPDTRHTAIAEYLATITEFQEESV